LETFHDNHLPPHFALLRRQQVYICGPFRILSFSRESNEEICRKSGRWATRALAIIKLVRKHRQNALNLANIVKINDNIMWQPATSAQNDWPSSNYKFQQLRSQNKFKNSSAWHE